jgi:hypothetical protein
MARTWKVREHNPHARAKAVREMRERYERMERLQLSKVRHQPNKPGLDELHPPA